MKLIRNSARAVAIVALLSGALLLAAAPASAAIVPSWSWSQGITFTSAVFSAGGGCQTVAGSLIEWAASVCGSLE